MRESTQTGISVSAFFGSIMSVFILASVFTCSHGPLVQSDRVACPLGDRSLCNELDDTFLRNLTQQTPDAFGEILVALDDDVAVWDSNRSEIGRILDAWPDEARQLPSSWISRIVNQEDLPLIGLVKTVSIDTCPSGGVLKTFIDNLDQYDQNNISILEVNRIQFTPELAARLAEADFTQHVESLDLSRNSIGPAESEHLFAGARFDELTNLDLSNNPLGEQGLQKLAQVDDFPRLTRLRLENVEADRESVRALAESDHLTGLEYLDLSWNSLGNDGGFFLSQVEFSNLESLNLERTALGSRGLEFLSNHEIGADIRKVNFSGNEISDIGIHSLVEASWVQNIEDVNLSQNSITSEGIRLVAASDNMSTLQALDISDNRTFSGKSTSRAEGRVERIEGLVESNNLTQLRELSIESLRLNNDDADALVNASFFPNIEKLEIAHNEIGCDGLVTILDSLNEGAIRVFGLGGDDIRGCFDIGVDVVELPRLEKLSLVHSIPVDLVRVMENIEAPMLRVLRLRRFVVGEVDDIQGLEEVDISNSSIGNSGIEGLVSGQGGRGLRRLGLNGIGIDDEGIEALKERSVLDSLELLEVTDNDLTDVGARKILLESSMTALRYLDLRENPVDISELRRIVEESGQEVVVEVTSENDETVVVGGTPPWVCTFTVSNVESG